MRIPSVVLVIFAAPILLMSQNQVLVVSGFPGSVPVIQSNGRNYVELETFAQVTNSNLSFNGNRIALTLPGATDSSSAQTVSSGLTRDFLRAGIEAMSVVREWHSVLQSAIENGYPLAQAGLSGYQGQAMTAVRLAQTSASSDDDKQAAQVILNEADKMKQLSEKYLNRRADMRYIAPDALKGDQLNQSLIACGKQLSAMAASGHFIDSPACH